MCNTIDEVASHRASDVWADNDDDDDDDGGGVRAPTKQMWAYKALRFWQRGYRSSKDQRRDLGAKYVHVHVCTIAELDLAIRGSTRCEIQR